MTIEVLDPSYDDEAPEFAPAPRPADLRALTVGIIDNGKEGTEPFFASLGRELVDEHGVGEVLVVTKTNYSAPAGEDIIDRARAWHAVVVGVGD